MHTASQTKPTAQRPTHGAPRSAKPRVATGRSDAGHPVPANLTVTVGDSGVCITADARKPAPEFAHAIKMLANPPLFWATESDALKKAKSRCAEAFGRVIVLDEDGNGYARMPS